MPNEVTPWLTAAKAYSISRLTTPEHDDHIFWDLTNLNELATTEDQICSGRGYVFAYTYLGEKVVREKE